jgi:hypothetical protein
MIRLLDITEKVRNLHEHELKLHIDLRTHAYNLAGIQEIKWQQRSNVNWLKKGIQTQNIFTPLHRQDEL